jgi:hypothetical protein
MKRLGDEERGRTKLMDVGRCRHPVRMPNPSPFGRVLPSDTLFATGDAQREAGYERT